MKDKIAVYFTALYNTAKIANKKQKLEQCNKWTR